MLKKQVRKRIAECAKTTIKVMNITLFQRRLIGYLLFLLNLQHTLTTRFLVTSYVQYIFPYITNKIYNRKITHRGLLHPPRPRVNTRLHHPRHLEVVTWLNRVQLVWSTLVVTPTSCQKGNTGKHKDFK